MKYKEVIHGTFIDRPNRFTAHVMVNGNTETVHVKNTGRCKELLLPEADVILEICSNPARKTKYDLIAVYKEGLGLVNIDSQATNKAAGEWLSQQGFDKVIPEYTYGRSRVDFYMERETERYLMEVKGCTLEVDGTGYFPDAPTERGIKHLKELTQAADAGYHCSLAFVIAMPGISEVRPNMKTHPAFGDALQTAVNAGVKVQFLTCDIREDELLVRKENRFPF